MRILHSADLHLGLALSQFESRAVQEIKTQIDSSLKKLKTKLATGHYDGLILVGDVFEDPKVSFYYMMLLTRIFETVLSNGGFVAYATGNHDHWVREEHFASLRKYDKFFPFFGPEFKSYEFDCGQDHVVLYGLGYGSEQPEQDVTKFYPPKSLSSHDIVIGLFHGDVGAGYTKSAYYSVDLGQIALKNYNYFAMGHVHSYMDKYSRMSYPGTPFPQGFDETMRASYNEVVIEHGVTEIKTISSVSYRILDLNLEVRAKSRADIVRAAQALLEKSMANEEGLGIIRLKLKVRGPRELQREFDEDLKRDIIGHFSNDLLELKPTFEVEENTEEVSLNPEILSALNEAVNRFREGKNVNKVQGLKYSELSLGEMLDDYRIEEALIADLEGRE